MWVDTSIGQSVARTGDPHMAIFINDICANLPSRQAWLNAMFSIKVDIFAAGCVTSKEKCLWDPHQIFGWDRMGDRFGRVSNKHS